MYIIIFASQNIDGICTFLIVKNCHYRDSVSILKCNNIDDNNIIIIIKNDSVS